MTVFPSHVIKHDVLQVFYSPSTDAKPILRDWLARVNARAAAGWSVQMETSATDGLVVMTAFLSKEERGPDFTEVVEKATRQSTGKPT